MKNYRNSHIRYLLTGAVAGPDNVSEVLAGANYSVPTPGIQGFYSTNPTVAGVMPPQDVELTVFYIPLDTTVVIDDYRTPLGLGNVSIMVGECIE